MAEPSAVSATDGAHAGALLCFLDADRASRPALSLCDVTLVAGERRFRAHRAVLAAGSAYFRRLFTAASAEAAGSASPAGDDERQPPGAPSAVYNVEIAGVEPDALELVLAFLYTASVRVDAARARSVRALGRALGVPFLAELPTASDGPRGDDEEEEEAAAEPPRGREAEEAEDGDAAREDDDVAIPQHGAAKRGGAGGRPASAQAKPRHGAVGASPERPPRGSSPAKAAEAAGVAGAGKRAAPGRGAGDAAEDGSHVVLKSLRVNVALGRVAAAGSLAAGAAVAVGDADPKWSPEKLRVRNSPGSPQIWCGECGQAFRTVPALRRHRDVYHNPNRPYLCGVCGKRFLTSYKAWTHRRTQHQAAAPGGADGVGAAGLEEATEDATARVFLVIPPFVSGVLHAEQAEAAEQDGGGDGAGHGGGGEPEEGRAEPRPAEGGAGSEATDAAKEGSDDGPGDGKPRGELAENATEGAQAHAAQERVPETTREEEEEQTATDDAKRAPEGEEGDGASDAGDAGRSPPAGGEGDGRRGDVNGERGSGADAEGESAGVDDGVGASIPEINEPVAETSPDESTDANNESRDRESAAGVDSETQTEAPLEATETKVVRKRKNISWGDEAAGGKLEERLLVNKISRFVEDPERSFAEEDDDDDDEKEEPPAELERSEGNARDGRPDKTGRKGCGYICAKCGKAFPFYCRFREHAKTHMLKRPYGCSVCPKTFRREGNLRMHQRRHRLELLAELGAAAASPTTPTPPGAAALVPPPPARARPPAARGSLRGADAAARDAAPWPAPPDEGPAAAAAGGVCGERGDAEPTQCRLCDLALASPDDRKAHEATCGQQRLMCRACGRTFRTAFSLWRHRLEVHHDSETFAFLPEGPAAGSPEEEAAAAAAAAAAFEPEREESVAAAASVAEAPSDAENGAEAGAPPTPVRAVYLASAAAPSAYSLLSLSDAAGALRGDAAAETDGDREAKAVSEILIVLGPVPKDGAKADGTLAADDAGKEEEAVEECQGGDGTHFVTVGLNANDEGDGEAGGDFGECHAEGATADPAGAAESESGARRTGDGETRLDGEAADGPGRDGCGAEEEEAVVAAAAVASSPRAGFPKPRLIQLCLAAPARRGGAGAASPQRDARFPYTCNKCGVVFSLAQQLERHHELFCEVKAFQCPDCNKSFRTNFRLWSHRQSFHWDGDAAPDVQSG